MWWLKHWRATLACAAGLYGLVLVYALVAIEAPDAQTGSSGTSALRNPPGMVDRLVMLDSAESWHGGSMCNVAAVSAGTQRLQMIGLLHDRDFPQTGTWESAVFTTDFPFTELLPSWNANIPANTGLRFEARVRDARGNDWSPWLYFGSWGKTLALDHRVIQYSSGEVATDILLLSRPASAYQLRTTFFSFDTRPNVTPSLRRLAVVYSGVPRNRTPEVHPGLHSSEWARDLNIPFRTQQDAPPALKGEICSPTSVSMVLDYYGINRPTVDHALAIYDAEYAMFGNWARAVQYAHEQGCDAWLERFRNWDQVRAKIAQGQPVIASIAFRKGAFPSAVFSQSSGHLIVIRGFTKDGDVIVNDPASRDKGNGAVYKQNELAKAWFGHGGVGYIIRKPDPVARASRP